MTIDQQLQLLRVDYDSLARAYERLQAEHLDSMKRLRGELVGLVQEMSRKADETMAAERERQGRADKMTRKMAILHQIGLHLLAGGVEVETQFESGRCLSVWKRAEDAYNRGVAAGVYPVEEDASLTPTPK